MQRVLIVGATSAMARHVARLYARRGASITLTSRNIREASVLAEELRVCGAAKVVPLQIDPVRSTGRDDLISALGPEPSLDVVLIAYGRLEPEQQLRDDPERLVASGLFQVNAESTIVLCMRLAQHLVDGGALGVITSVAGERGRAYNACYGATKAAVSTFLSGFRQHLHQRISVVDIRPGPVNTPMTLTHNKSWLMTEPSAVAPVILRALDRGTAVIRIPAKWNLIMCIVRNLPLAIFHRTRF